MPKYRIISQVRVYYVHQIETDTKQEAIDLVKEGEDDGVEYDSSCIEIVEIKEV